MNEYLSKAMHALKSRLKPGLSASVKFEILEVGTFMIFDGVVSTGANVCDCTLYASKDDFRALLEKSMSPASAYISGKLRIEGNLSVAMQLGNYIE